MWYEILPSFGIIVACVAMPHGLSYIANKLLVDNYYRRSMLDKYEILQYMRDIRLSGSAYKIKGLENIPDE